MINGFDIDMSILVTEKAFELADLFEEYIEYDNEALQSDEAVYLTGDGMEAMGDAFGEILPSLRGAVFESLLDELVEREIPFDIEQFKYESRDL